MEAEKAAKAEAEKAALAAREAAASRERDEKRRKMEALVGGMANPAPTGGAALSFGSVTVVRSAAELSTLLAAASTNLVVVDYMAPWCGPCRGMAPAYAAMAAELTDVAFLKVDCDALPDASAAAGILAFPTLHVCFRGRQLANFTGADMRRLRAEIEAGRAAVEDALTNDAIASSMQEGVVEAAPPARSGTAVPSAPPGGAGSSAAAPSAKATGGAAPTAAAAASAASFRLHLSALRGALPAPQFVSAARTLEKYLSGIASHPGAPAYTRIKRTNPAFTDALGRHGGPAVALLTDAGFAPVEDAVHGPCLVHPSAAATEGAEDALDRLRACHAALQGCIAQWGEFGAGGGGAALPVVVKVTSDGSDAAELAVAMQLSEGE